MNERQLRLVYDTIEEQIAEAISVAALSSLAGLSRSRFSLAFRRSVGRAPHEHIVQVRLARAMELMSETVLPLRDIALAAGFYDQAHFTNTFRRGVGLTPTAWRKRIRTAQAEAEDR